MHKINLRELRDTRQLKVWLRSGETVELRERDRVLGRIIPNTPIAAPSEWPDFTARTKKLFGKRVFPGADLLIEERGRY